MKEEIKKEMLQNGIQKIEIIERTGKAPDCLPVKEPEALRLTGTIESPARFVEKRKHLINPDNTHVYFSVDDGFIALTINETDFYNAVICGKITKSIENIELGINTERIYTPKDLARTLRKKKYLFPNKEEATAVIAALNNFTAKVNQEYNAIDDKKGGVKRSFEQIVKSNLPSGFCLNMPICKGFQKQLVNIEIDVTEDRNCMLFSDELFQLENELKEEAIFYQLEKLAEYVQIEY